MVPKNPELEHDIQNEIRLWCGEHDLLAIRINVGIFRDFLRKSLKMSGLFLFCTYRLLLPFLLPSPKAVPLHRQTTHHLSA